MKKILKHGSMISMVAAATAVVVSASVALARPPQECPDVWLPVICSDGNICSNFCYAANAGATGCVRFYDDI